MTTNAATNPRLLESPRGLRWRPDLQTAELSGRFTRRYVVKDPASLRYFQLSDYEYELLLQVEQNDSFDELRQWFERRFPPFRLSLWQLQGFLRNTCREGLLVSTVSGSSEDGGRSDDRGPRTWLKRMANPWAIRLPGAHPGWILDILAPLCSWLLSPVFVLPAVLSLAILMLFAAAHAAEIVRLLPDPQAFIHPGNVIWLSGCVILTKVFHEIGHAMAARRHGVECHEMGILLMAGLPTLYCDVSDAWMLPDRWRRIQISLAGIWFDLLAGGLATAIWLSTAPGLLNTVALNLAVVCSVSTLVFNLNPLLRYDGYYVLMDLVETPNLGQTASQALQRWWHRWGLGLPAGLEPGWQPTRAWHALYGAASFAYRFGLILAILLFAHAALRPYGLSNAVWGMAIIASGAGTSQLIKTTAQSTRRIRRSGVPVWRIAAGYAGLVLVLIAVLQLPWSTSVVAEGIVEPAASASIYAVVPGRLVACQPPGTRVAAGDVVANLDNSELRLRLEELESELNDARLRLQLIEARRNEDPVVAEQRPVAVQQIESLENRAVVIRSELNLLQLRAPQGGKLFPGVFRAKGAQTDELPHWSGQLNSSENASAWVASGDVVCCVGEPGRSAMTAYVPETLVDRLSVGRSADVMLRADPERIYRARVTELSRRDLNPEQQNSVLLQDLRWSVDDRGQRRLAETIYLVRLEFEDALPPTTLPRSRAQVRIAASSQKLWQWLMEETYRTLRWRL